MVYATSFLFFLDNHERIDSTQQQGALIKYSSPSHVVINNPGKISYANFLLEVKDEIKVKIYCVTCLKSFFYL